MKTLRKVQAQVEIGPLDGKLRLSMIGRLKRGMKTICDVCGKPITDAFFIGGFKVGHPNLKLHESCAVEEEEAAVLIERGLEGGTDE